MEEKIIKVISMCLGVIVIVHVHRVILAISIFCDSFDRHKHVLLRYLGTF